MQNIDVHASSPDIRGAVKLTARYLDANANNYNDSEKEIGSELKRRIRRLESDCNRLVKLNNRLLDSDQMQSSFDQENDTLTIRHRGQSHSIKLNRANPEKPLSIPGAAATSAYVARADDEDEQSEVDEFKMAMEQSLEHYYANAFRITKLIQKLTGRSKFHCPPITMVRNKLVEHPESGSLYSFGYGSNGPLVKPMQRGKIEFRDNGLVPNTIALLESINDVFRDCA